MTSGTFRGYLLIVLLIALFAFFGSLFGVVEMTIAIAFAVCVGFWSFWESGPAILRISGARELTQADDRPLLDCVSKLSALAGIPMPHVFEVEEDQPNAMAVGANPQMASLVLTTGLRRVLRGEELEAIIAHELSHIKTRDTLAACIAAAFVDAILTLSLVLCIVGLAARKHGGGFAIGLAIIAPITALILHLAASRSREYEADRFGASLTSRQSMIEALRKLQKATQKKPNQIALNAPATAAMWFIDPLANTWIKSIFSTHPSVEKRIARLEQATT